MEKSVSGALNVLFCTQPESTPVCAIPFDSCHRINFPKAHLVPLKTGEAVTVSVIGEVAQVIFAVGLLLAVEHRDMRCDLALEQPCQESARAVGFVSRQSIGAERVPLGGACQHWGLMPESAGSYAKAV